MITYEQIFDLYRITKKRFSYNLALLFLNFNDNKPVVSAESFTLHKVSDHKKITNDRCSLVKLAKPTEPTIILDDGQYRSISATFINLPMKEEIANALQKDFDIVLEWSTRNNLLVLFLVTTDSKMIAKTRALTAALFKNMSQRTQAKKDSGGRDGDCYASGGDAGDGDNGGGGDGDNGGGGDGDNGGCGYGYGFEISA
ncbi:uncharacterized protein LOC130648510 [Hydractinia symbiolongicarpus]|uniref:uncharacterized protein LOC130648510 n=1 Tax=Hydractinia symbiolongicarpus TaxID=13093 RepID=UPI002551B0C1|nr:uncharacterized protein LOC130648510 [Hydractinia symbiolongicarpus]